MSLPPDLVQYQETREITSGLLIKAVCAQGTVGPEYKEILESYELIQQAIGKMDILIARVRAYLRDPGTDFEAKGDGYKLLATISAGRIMITLRDLLPQGQGKFGGAWLTIIAAQDSNQTAGLQGLCATRAEALALLRAAAREAETLTFVPAGLTVA